MAELQFLVDDKRAGGDRFEEEFQTANRGTQYQKDEKDGMESEEKRTYISRNI